MCFQESCSLVNLQLCFWRAVACLGEELGTLCWTCSFLLFATIVEVIHLF